MCNIDFSIIIPQRKSLDSLPRLFKSIPVSDKIEVLLIDNSPEPISGKDVQTIHPFQLLHSNPHSFAGGARNIGLDNAHGKWLIFADADDFFTPQAFDIFYSHFADEEDLIYFKSDSVYDDTLEPSNRNSLFNAYIDDYVLGKIDDIKTIGIIYIDAKLEITVAFTILVIGNKKRNNPNMPISHNICKNS